MVTFSRTKSGYGISYSVNNKGLGTIPKYKNAPAGNPELRRLCLEDTDRRMRRQGECAGRKSRMPQPVAPNGATNGAFTADN